MSGLRLLIHREADAMVELETIQWLSAGGYIAPLGQGQWTLTEMGVDLLGDLSDAVTAGKRQDVGDV